MVFLNSARREQTGALLTNRVMRRRRNRWREVGRKCLEECRLIRSDVRRWTLGCGRMDADGIVCVRFGCNRGGLETVHARPVEMQNFYIRPISMQGVVCRRDAK